MLFRSGLDPIGEDIILDAANLQVRGSFAGNEARNRKSMVRFVENLKQKFNISEAEAIELTASVSDTSTQSIKTNLVIESELNNGLKEMLDSNTLSKTASIALVKLSDTEQEEVYDNLKDKIDEPLKFQKEVTTTLKKIKDQEVVLLENKKKAIREGDRGETSAGNSLVLKVSKDLTFVNKKIFGIHNVVKTSISKSEDKVILKGYVDKLIEQLQQLSDIL